MTTKTYRMTLGKASPDDFKAMWKISKLVQNYGYEFYPDDDDRRAVRIRNHVMARLDDLGTGGFMRVVLGCEMLIREVCDPAMDHIALKPEYGAAPVMLAALKRIDEMCAAPPDFSDSTIQDIARAAIAKATENNSTPNNQNNG